MLIDLIVAAVLAPVAWLLELLPSVTLPGWLTGGGMEDRAAAIGVQVGAFNNWFPVTELMAVVPVLFALAGAVLVFKATQFVVSMFTGGGGST
jgi:hypothetical protein